MRRFWVGGRHARARIYLLPGWTRRAWPFENIGERIRAIDLVALRIARRFYDTGTSASFDGALPGHSAIANSTATPLVVMNVRLHATGCCSIRNSLRSISVALTFVGLKLIAMLLQDDTHQLAARTDASLRSHPDQNQGVLRRSPCAPGSADPLQLCRSALLSRIWVPRLANKVKENTKTVQGISGHSRIQTTLDLYTNEDLDEMIAAQGKFIDAVGLETETSNEGVDEIVGWTFGCHSFQLAEKNGGDDGTRTRGLCRDRAAF
jgi:hypothetical protein